MFRVFKKSATAVLLVAVILIPVSSVSGQRKSKLSKSENLEIAPVEVIQVLDHAVNITDGVLTKTDKGYVFKCSISNNLIVPVTGLDYMLLVIDANDSRVAVLSASERLQLKDRETKDLVSKTFFGLNVTRGYRLILIPNRVFAADSIWEVPKPVAALEAVYSGDYSIIPRATRSTNLVDTPIGGRVIP
ncbi:MAG TPA: hypothetical protein VMS31_21000 [Pyrinomonadaceae bacterium]|nr:hypothetical protein [Pyrinomonadaceae bacterium]